MKVHSVRLFIFLSIQFLSVHLQAQFTTSGLNSYSLTNGTALQFGPDGRLYVTQQDGFVKVYTIQRNSANNYQVIKTELISLINQMPNYNDDGSASATKARQVTGIWVEGTSTNPIIYIGSSDSRIGGPSGDKNLDTNSGIITRLTWKAASTPANTDFSALKDGDLWDKVDLVRGLPRSEENHASNGMQVYTVNGKKYLFLSSGGNTNAGSPSRNFTKITEYALSCAVLAIDLTVVEAMPVLGSGLTKYIYDIPTVDDPRRNNANGINNPSTAGYNGIDINDPFGGDDGLNQGKIVQGGPVQIFSPGYRNTYDLLITKAGRMYVSDNGANGGWGGLPQNEGPAVNGQSLVTNNYHYILDGSGNVLEPGGDPGTSYNGQTVNNKDNLHLITGKGTNTISNYVFGSYYGGHPVPIRANPTGAGLYTHDGANSDFNGYFRTSYTGNSSTTLPYDWPPVPASMADSRQGDFRNPGTNLSLGEDGALLTWNNNTNPLTEYTASNLSGAYKGNILAGHSNGYLHRVELNADGSLKQLTQNFASPGGTCLGLTAQGDNEIFPGTIWIAAHGGEIKVMEPQDYDGGGGITCLQPGQTGYDALADYDNDGYKNQDEISNNTDHCASSIFPTDFDKDFVSDLNDTDDDNDGILDYLDPFQMGIPYELPIKNELFSDKMSGFRGLGLTGLMTNLKSTDNYLNWMDKPGDGDGVDDIYGGAVGAITVYMTPGTAYGTTNTQAKAFQFGLNMDQSKGTVTVHARMLAPYHNHTAGQSQGIFIGNGDQDNYLSVNLVANGYEVVKEIAGVPQKTFYAYTRPSTSLDIYFLINPVDGTVQPKISVNGAEQISLGSPVSITGALLAAIQQPNTPMAVGLIGNNGGTSEFPVNIDYFSVEGASPYISKQFENVNLFLGGTDYSMNLADYFDDDNGDGQLTFSIQQNTLAGVTPTIQGSTLSIPVPDQATSGILKIRATDGDANFVEQNVSVAILAEALVLLRVNAGGPEITALDQGKPNWMGDSSTIPSPYVNGGSSVASFDGLTLHQSVNPDIVPAGIFTQERWDDTPAPEMLWTFPVQQPGTYEVRLYLRNGYGGTTTPGSRVFSVKIEGQSIPSLTNIDLSGTYGHQVGVMLNAIVQSDENLQIEFIHGVENPLVNGIEILRVVSGSGSNAPPVITSIPNQTNKEGDQPDIAVMASDSDNLIYSISGQPAGLEIEPTNGHITGIIASGASANSPYTVTVSVSDQVNPPVSTTFTWTVTPLYALTMNITGNGSVNKSPDKVVYDAGDIVQLTATPMAGWLFDHWEGSLTGNTNPVNITMSSNKVITAFFAQQVTTYSLNVNVSGSGLVSKLPDKVNYNAGEMVQITATPITGWQFSNWSGNASGSVNPLSITMDANKSITANFTQTPTNGQQVISYTLVNAQTDQDVMTIVNEATVYSSQLSGGVNIRANTNPTIVGSVVMTLSGATSASRKESTAPYALFGDSNGNYSAGTINLGIHTLTSTPYTKAGGGGTAGTPLTVSFTVINDSNPVSYTLTTNVTGSGSVIKSPTKTSYTSGESVQLTASPSTGWLFDHWEGSLTGNTNPATITMNSNKVVTAVFIQQATTYSLNITVNGSGSVTKSPDKASYTSGEIVQLTASPTTGWLFDHWEGSLTGNTNPATITMNTNKVINAVFVQQAITYSLSVNVNGNGTVIKSPDKVSYNGNEIVQLTATPATGWQFSSWSGSASGSTNPLLVTMNTNKSISANFAQLPINAQQVISFTLVNAQTDQDVMTMTNGGTINIAQLVGIVNIRANTNPSTVGSVVMKLSGATTTNSTESVAPYALFGDSNGNYNLGAINTGNHAIIATPYTSSGGSGTAGTPLSINFTVINDPTKPSSARVNSDEDDQIDPKTEFIVYPNPITDQINIKMMAPESTNISINIIDLVGRVIENRQVNLTQRGDVLSIGADKFSNGLYIIKIVSGDGNIYDFKIMKY